MITMKAQLREFFFGSSAGTHPAAGIGLLLFRLHLGLSIAIHAGWPKMYTLSAPGWFADQVAGLGFNFPSPAFWAALASWGEFIGGICIALGLLTRFSALQLAFQFFVISFLWYNNPEPLTGMYFQNSLFMGFLLLVFTGAGKYSVDQLILNRKLRWNNRPVRTAVATVAFLVISIGSQAQSLKATELQPAAGTWKGTLTYVDYSSEKKETIKAGVVLQISGENEYSIGFFYSEEPDHNQTMKYVIKENGSLVNDKKLVEKTRLLDGTLRIVLESRGTDGNDLKQAILRDVLIIGPNSLTIAKWVLYDDADEYFERNRYVFTR